MCLYSTINPVYSRYRPGADVHNFGRDCGTIFPQAEGYGCRHCKRGSRCRDVFVPAIGGDHVQPVWLHRHVSDPGGSLSQWNRVWHPLQAAGRTGGTPSRVLVGISGSGYVSFHCLLRMPTVQRSTPACCPARRRSYKDVGRDTGITKGEHCGGRSICDVFQTDIN